MVIKHLLFILALFNCISATATDDPLVVPSELKTVTVYRSGGELVHNTSAQLQQGNSELVIEGISNTVDMNSVQINVPAAVTILSVEFGNNFLVAPEVSSSIKLLQDSAGRVQKELDKTLVQISTTTDLLEVLKANREIKGQQTGLSVAELIKLMDYYKQKSTELQNELATLKEKQKKLLEQVTKIKTQIREEEAKNTRNRGQLKLQLSVAAAGKYDFVVSYITPNAYWTPYYDVRVDNIKSPLKIIYKAKIVQTTGIDWKKVKLSLSTSVPNQWGVAPVLKSWFLSYIDPVAAMERGLYKSRQMSNSIQSFEEALQGRVAGVATAAPTAANEIRVRGFAKEAAEPLYLVNGVPMSADNVAKLNQSTIKNIETLKDAQATSLYGSRAANGVVVITLKEGLDDYVSVTDNELNVSFDIDLPYDVPTNGKEQTATLKEYSVGVFYKYYAVPRLDKDAYLLAEVADWEKLNLLPGDANIIFEGTYVGKSFIDPASTADTLNLTLGRDKRVVVKKEKLMDFSSVKFMGSSKLQKFTYEITVKNNKKDSVNMLLKDQYPLTTLKEIEVELLDAGGATTNTDIGVLTWKLALAPGESKKIRFSYSVKYPKDRLLNLN
ncbi:MAG TPA: mucoidy inhibitor MuiA family protein [Flavisolibacter sp.]|nr:mucoidy inhibitor MuiA family protein [Flavisolibacter sp.]